MMAVLIATRNAPGADALEEALRAAGHAVTRLAGFGEFSQQGEGQGQQLVVALASPDGNGVAAAIAFAEANARSAYLIYVSEDIPAADFRRLLDTRAAEWIPAADAASAIQRTIENSPAGRAAQAQSRGANFISFVPAGGGVGNTTLAVESALHHAAKHRAKEPNCCVVDLNFQQGNACDLLDLQPKLDMEAIAPDPGRLDYRLLEAFRSRSEFGVDVFAAPKFPANIAAVTPEGVFALCNVLSERYARVHADFPSYLFPWMFDIIQASDKLIVTTLCSVPHSLRVQTLLGELRGIDPKKIAIAVNRHQNGLFSKSLSKQNFEASIDCETFVYIGEDQTNATECANIGKPMMAAAPKGRASKDIQKLEEFIDPPEVKTGLFGRAFSKFKSA